MGIIKLNGIKYKPVPAKTDDKICKDCDYFLDNGICDFEVCPIDKMDDIEDKNHLYVFERVKNKN